MTQEGARPTQQLAPWRCPATLPATVDPADIARALKHSASSDVLMTRMLASRAADEALALDAALTAYDTRFPEDPRAPDNVGSQSSRVALDCWSE